MTQSAGMKLTLHPPLPSLPFDVGGAEIHLSLSWPLGQRHKHLPVVQTPNQSDSFDRYVFLRMDEVDFEQIQDRARRVVILAVYGLVALQDRVECLQEGAVLPFGTRKSWPLQHFRFLWIVISGKFPGKNGRWTAKEV